MKKSDADRRAPVNITADLVTAIQSELKRPFLGPPYKWPVGRVAWNRLGAGFNPILFPDPAKQNIALRKHLEDRWARADAQERIRLATWIIKDWGGIGANNPTTIDRYVAMAETPDPTTPFAGVSSYSKVLSMRDPDKFAIYDARVAASLNAIQLIQLLRGVPSVNLLAFPAPSSRNNEVKRFCEMCPREILTGNYGFQRVPDDDAFGVYLMLLGKLKEQMNQSILEVEMALFARSEDFCSEARSRVIASSTPPAVSDVPPSDVALLQIEQLVSELAMAIRHGDVQTHAIVGRLTAVADRLLALVADAPSESAAS
jgi:hypothetical protein